MRRRAFIGIAGGGLVALAGCISTDSSGPSTVGPLIASTPVARLSRLVPAGDTVTIAVTDTWTGAPLDDVGGDGDPDVTYHLDYPGDETSAGIRILDPA